MRPFDFMNETPSGSGEQCASLPLGDGWRLTLWLGDQAGRTVVTELRLHPDEGSAVQAAHQPPGWSHSEQTRFHVMPTGGITARTLKNLTLGRHIGAARAAVARKLRIEGQLREGTFEMHEVAAAMPAAGRRGRPDAFYAHLAQEYLQTVRAGSPAPLVEIANRMGSNANTVAARIKEARRRGLLSRTDRGRSGGELTDKARELLAVAGDED